MKTLKRKREEQMTKTERQIELQRIKRQALEEVNEIRTELNLPIVPFLPKGLVRDLRHCPVALALPNGQVSYDSVIARHGLRRKKRNHPHRITRFAKKFDAGQYPELLKDGG